MSARNADSSASGAAPSTECRGSRSSETARAIEIGLRCAGTDNWSTAAGACERPQQAEPGFACVLDVSGRCVCDDDDVGADSGLDRLGPGNLRSETVDRGGLLDVERFPARDLIRGIDQPYFRHAVAHGKRVRDGTTKRAAADDRNESHRARLF